VEFVDRWNRKKRLPKC